MQKNILIILYKINMFKKTIITEFFTTIDFSIFLRTIWLLSYKLPILRYWFDISYVEKQLLFYIWNLDSNIISFYNWRSAIYHALKLIWIKKNDEVIVSWYTCISVSNAVIQAWVKINYIDIDKNNLWLSISELRKKHPSLHLVIAGFGDLESELKRYVNKKILGII